MPIINLNKNVPACWLKTLPNPNLDEKIVINHMVFVNDVS